jgi:hypothetical protein
MAFGARCGVLHLTLRPPDKQIANFSELPEGGDARMSAGAEPVNNFNVKKPRIV